MAMSFTFTLDGEDHEISILARRPDLSLSIDGLAYKVSQAPAPLDEADRAAVLIAAALAVDEFHKLVYDTPEPYASMSAWRN